MVTRAINLNLPLALHVRGPVKAMNSKPLTTAFGYDNNKICLRIIEFISIVRPLI